MVKDKTEPECNACLGDRYFLIGCCSGIECGCMGKPVAYKPCKYCNVDGKLPPSKSLAELGILDYLEYEQ